MVVQILKLSCLINIDNSLPQLYKTILIQQVGQLYSRTAVLEQVVCIVDVDELIA